MSHAAEEESRLRAELEARVEECTAALAESEARYRALLESLPDAVVVQDRGQVRYANAAALRLFGAATFEELAAHDLVARLSAGEPRQVPDGRPRPDESGTSSGPR